MLGMSPPPEESLLDLGAGQDALEAELVHIDEQLMNIEDDLGHIDEAFIMMDQQLAESISEDVYDTADNVPELSLDNLGVEQEEDEQLANPFDDWQRDALADIESLAMDSVGGGAEVPQQSLNNNQLLASHEIVLTSANSLTDVSGILDDHNLFPTDEANFGSAILEEFDEDLFGGSNLSKLTVSVEQVVRQDVSLPQMELEPVLTRETRVVKEEEREESLDRELLEQCFRMATVCFVSQDISTLCVSIS